MRVSFAIEITNAHDVLESLRAHRAGIHAQAAADCARNSFHPFQTAESGRLRRIGDFLQFRADAGRDFVSGDFDLVEIAAARMNDHAANSAIAHEQIRTATNDEERKIFAPAKTDQLARKLSSLRGSTQNCAGPPTRSVVCFASGS